MAKSSKEERQGGSTERQARGWDQDTLQDKDEAGRRGRKVQMSACRLSFLAGRRDAQHGGLSHPSGSVNPDDFDEGSG